MVHLQRRKRIAAFSVGPSGLTVTSLMRLLLLIVCILGCIFHSNSTNLFEKRVAKIVSARLGGRNLSVQYPSQSQHFWKFLYELQVWLNPCAPFNIFKLIKTKRKLGFVQLLTNRCQCGAVGAA